MTLLKRLTLALSVTAALGLAGCGGSGGGGSDSPGPATGITSEPESYSQAGADAYYSSTGLLGSMGGGPMANRSLPVGIAAKSAKHATSPGIVTPTLGLLKLAMKNKPSNLATGISEEFTEYCGTTNPEDPLYHQYGTVSIAYTIASIPDDEPTGISYGLSSGDNVNVTATNCYINEYTKVNGSLSARIASLSGQPFSTVNWNGAFDVRLDKIQVINEDIDYSQSFSADGDIRLGVYMIGEGEWTAISLSGNRLGISYGEGGTTLVSRTWWNYRINFNLTNSCYDGCYTYLTTDADFTLTGYTVDRGNFSYTVKTEEPFMSEMDMPFSYPPYFGTLLVSGDSSSVRLIASEDEYVSLQYYDNAVGTGDPIVPATEMSWEDFYSYYYVPLFGYYSY